MLGLLSVSDAAWVMKIPKRSVYEIIAEGMMPVIKIGPVILIKRKDLDDFMQKQISLLFMLRNPEIFGRAPE